MLALLALLLAGSPDAGPAPIAVESRALADAFDSNEVAANRRYKGKLVRVTGILNGVDQDTEGITFRLAVRNPYLSTFAGLDSSAASKDDRIEKLTRGDKVIVTCVCVGRQAGTVLLGGCVLEKAFRHPSE